jgi:hypothetical protein
MIDEPQNIDQIVGAKLQLPPDNVRHIRLQWNDEAIMHAVFNERFKKRIELVRSELENVKSFEEMRAKQAEIVALRLALAYVTKTESIYP